MSFIIAGKKKGQTYSFGEMSDLVDAVEYRNKLRRMKKAKGFTDLAVLEQGRRIY